MKTSDALMFPFMASGALFGLYILFRLFSKEYINLLLTIYFLLFGIIALSTTSSPLFAKFIPSTKKYQIKYELPIISKVDFSFNNADILATVIATAVAVWYSFTKNWIVNNIIGFCFCVQGIALLSVNSFGIASLLLLGLFVYDIFWVFGTDVMVTVAKNFDAPIKLLFPKNIFAETFQFSMLGLGDIVIPGIFIALMLRFDRKNAFEKDGPEKLLQRRYTHFDKYYFATSLFAYTLGLVTTIVVMHTFKAAQPALLYLVPYCLLFTLYTAAMRGELTKLFQYTEATEEKSPEKK